MSLYYATYEYKNTLIQCMSVTKCQLLREHKIITLL